MKNDLRMLAIISAVSLAGAGIVGVASAQESSPASRIEVSVLGGLQALNKNDTAPPDAITNVPAIATVAYHFSPLLAVEGEFTWLIPIKQSVDLLAGPSQDRKTPNILAYQANVRTSWPQSQWTPYLTAGLGAVTFLSNTEVDRLPRLGSSETAFALNFGAGATYGLGGRWALRGDFRELAAFPSSDATGLSSAGNADPIWMERGVLGVAYRF